MRPDLDAAKHACASDQFASLLVSRGPYNSTEDVISAARHIWWHEVTVQEWFKAFAEHPRLGDIEALRAKELAQCNRMYEEKFGHVFLLCASGKTAAEILDAVKARLRNSPATELMNAAKEQMKITELRLRKLIGPQASPSQGSSAAEGTSPSLLERRTDQLLTHLGGKAGKQEPGGKPPSCHITTHVLDTAVGRPAAGVPICLHRRAPGSAPDADIWEEIARGVTNQDGRISDWLPPSTSVDPGVYRITFETSSYMAVCKERFPDFFPAVPFYPKVSVFFEITDAQSTEHFHVPLTWNPYGYSTYRGS